MAILLDAYARPPQEVSVAVVSDDVMRDLNRQFRDQDEATDVLTFVRDPQGPEPDWLLGDIAISYETAKRQAAARMASLDDECCRLAIHGGLHLLGFDDSTDDQRDDMVRRMSAIAVQVGLSAEPDWSSMPHGGPA